MSWFNRIRSATSRLASNTLSGARRLASNIIPESVQRRITDFGNWLTGHVGPDQTPQVLNEIFEHVRVNFPPRQSFEVRESNSALRDFARVYTVDGIEGFDARSFLDHVRENITRVLRNNRGTKVKLIFICYMEKPSNIGETIIKEFGFHSNIHINLEGTDEDDIYILMTERIFENMASFQSEGSAWRLYRITKLDLHTVRYDPLREETWIPLPKELDNKKAIINMKNNDDICFLWCVLRALNPCGKKNPQRIDKKIKEKENILNMDGIEYPVSLNDIDKFEKQNPTISITVFGYKEKGVHPLRNSVNMDREHKIVLMLIEKDGVKHYFLVKNISRLLSSQVSNHNGKKYFCLRCLNPFQCEQSLNKHLEYCGNHEAVKIEMPKKGDILKFENYYKGERLPFIIYADTESLIKPIQSCEPSPQSSYTKKYQKHEPISFSYYIKCFDDNVFKPRLRSNSGEDAMQKFVEWLEEDIKIIANIPEVDMIFGKEEAARYKKETKCWICKGELKKDDKKVRDHCHFTGRYRGAAHNSCNLKYRKPNFTPVVFHNLSGYDSHLFIKNLGFTVGNIDCIPNNEEKYISFTKNTEVGTYIDKKGETKPIYHKIRFIDSFKFMAASLDSIVNNLPEDAFNNLKKYYTGDKLSLVKRKGVYPYEYMDSLERFKETKLPPKEAFYSKLTEEDISDEDYTHAKKVWKEFKMEHFQDYHNLYNKTDVLLLADVFESFRDICIKNYKLDPAHYFTAPSLSWDACLKMSGVKLELLSDVDMLLMMEKGIRGGVSMISNRD